MDLATPLLPGSALVMLSGSPDYSTRVADPGAIRRALRGPAVARTAPGLTDWVAFWAESWRMSCLLCTIAKRAELMLAGPESGSLMLPWTSRAEPAGCGSCRALQRAAALLLEASGLVALLVGVILVARSPAPSRHRSRPPGFELRAAWNLAATG